MIALAALLGVVAGVALALAAVALHQAHRMNPGRLDALERGLLAAADACKSAVAAVEALDGEHHAQAKQLFALDKDVETLCRKAGLKQHAAN